MDKKTIGILVAVVLLAVVAGGFAILGGKQSDKQQSASVNAGQHNESDGHAHAPGQGHADDKEKTENKTSGEVQSGQVQMDIINFAFAQENLKIKKGTTVTWTNRDEAKHDVSPDTASPNFEPSKLLAMGESYSYTFNEVGTYDYHCTPHPYMKATVEVVE